MVSNALAKPARYISQPINSLSLLVHIPAIPQIDSPFPNPISRTMQELLRFPKYKKFRTINFSYTCLRLLKKSCKWMSMVLLNFKSIPYIGHNSLNAFFCDFDMCCCRALYHRCDSGISFLRFNLSALRLSSMAMALLSVNAYTSIEVNMKLCYYYHWITNLTGALFKDFVMTF